MLQALLAYARGAGVDARWLVISGDPAFFAADEADSQRPVRWSGGRWRARPRPNGRNDAGSPGARTRRVSRPAERTQSFCLTTRRRQGHAAGASPRGQARRLASPRGSRRAERSGAASARLGSSCGPTLEADARNGLNASRGAAFANLAVGGTRSTFSLSLLVLIRILFHCEESEPMSDRTLRLGAAATLALSRGRLYRWSCCSPAPCLRLAAAGHRLGPCLRDPAWGCCCPRDGAAAHRAGQPRGRTRNLMAVVTARSSQTMPIPLRVLSDARGTGCHRRCSIDPRPAQVHAPHRTRWRSLPHEVRGCVDLACAPDGRPDEGCGGS